MMKEQKSLSRCSKEGESMDVMEAIRNRHITDEDGIGKKMAKILNVPDGYELVCFLPVGIAENEPACPPKKAFGERAWFNAYPV